MDNPEEHIVIRTQAVDKYEYIEAYRDAVYDALMLLFERRELDLSAEQLYSLHLLAFTAKNMVIYRPSAHRQQPATSGKR